MAQTKIKAGLFEGIIGNGTDGYFLMSNGDGTMTWSSLVINPTITSIAYPGSVTAADPAGGETITVTGTGFKTGATVTIGGTAAPAVSYVSETQITFTTPAKAAGDYDIVVTNTDTGSATFINGISYNGIPTWTTAAGSLGTFASDTTISTITLQATEPDAGTITFSITNGALPTGLSLTGANIDGTTTLETADTLYTFTVTATDDESQATPRTFTITVTKQFLSTENFTINTYTGNGSTQSIEGKIGTAADFNGSSSHIDLGTTDFIQNNNTLSISAWCYFEDLSTASAIVTKWNNSGVEESWWFGHYGAGSTTLHFAHRDANNNVTTVYSNTGALSTNTWHHCVLVWNEDTVTLYVDGSQVGTSTDTNFNSPTKISSANIIIGAQNEGTGSQMTGKIDQVRAFNRALSSSEVTTLYGENNASSTKSTTDIFDDGSGVALYEFEKGAKDTGGVTGYIGSGGIFNGNGNYITTPQVVNANSAFSLSMWVNPVDVSGCMLYTNAINNGFAFGYDIDNTTQGLGVWKAGVGTLFTSGNDVTANTWQHLVLTYDGSGNWEIYKDGVSIHSQSSTTHTFASATNSYIGRDFSTSFDYNGKIDQFRIFDKALSSSEVTTLYGETSASATKSTTDIFDDGSAVALYELEGNALDTGPEAGYSIDGSIRSLLNGDYFDTTVNQATTHSISFWAKIPTSTGASRSISTTTNSSGDIGYVFRTGSNNNELQFVDIQGGATSNSSTWSSIESDQWKHFVIVLDSTEARIYENNVLKATVTAANVTLQNGGNIRFGAGIYYGSDAYLEYKHIRTYLRALNTTEINTLYNENFTNLNVISSPQSWFNFDNNSSGSVNDKTGSYTGTISGMTYTAPSNYDGTATNVSYAYDGTPTNVSFVGTSFQPDFLWVKRRDGSMSHSWANSVSGTNVILQSNETGGEAPGALITFNTNGYSFGDGNALRNTNGASYVAWAWKAGGTAVSNTDGSITSSVSANQDAGFSIVKASLPTNGASNGDTIGHGLDTQPELIIYKATSISLNWYIFSEYGGSLLGSNNVLKFTTDAATSDSLFDITPTTFKVGSTNTAHDLVAYCFHSVDGYQKVGSYTGTGVANSAIINTGFLPRWVMIKRTDAGNSNWFILDSIRDTVAPYGAYLLPAYADQEYNSATYSLYFENTGFTVNSTNSQLNALNGTYIYLAIA